VPNFVKARESSRTKTCVANLKAIDSAKEQWAMDEKKNDGADCAESDLVGTGKYLKSSPSCPSAGTYTYAKVGTNPTCSTGGTHVLP